MTASEDFKKELRKDDLGIENIRNALKTALSEAIELKITTWVVPEGTVSSEGDRPQPGYRMQTRINIVDGNIDNEIGSPFVGDGPYTELRTFHLKQVEDGREIIEQNLVNLQHLFGVLFGTLKQLSQPHNTVNVEQPQRTQNFITSRSTVSS